MALDFWTALLAGFILYHLVPGLIALFYFKRLSGNWIAMAGAALLLILPSAIALNALGVPVFSNYIWYLAVGVVAGIFWFQYLREAYHIGMGSLIILCFIGGPLLWGLIHPPAVGEVLWVSYRNKILPMKLRKVRVLTKPRPDGVRPRRTWEEVVSEK